MFCDGWTHNPKPSNQQLEETRLRTRIPWRIKFLALSDTVIVIKHFWLEPQNKPLNFSLNFCRQSISSNESARCTRKAQHISWRVAMKHGTRSTSESNTHELMKKWGERPGAVFSGAATREAWFRFRRFHFGSIRLSSFRLSSLHHRQRERSGEPAARAHTLPPSRRTRTQT